MQYHFFQYDMENFLANFEIRCLTISCLCGCGWNNNLNFFVKIHKMDIELNMWQTRDLTLYGRTMLVKSLGISKVVYVASMLSVPETVPKTVQDRIFKFLRKNKKDKVKRKVIYQPFSHSGVNFPNVHTVVKSLRLS